MMTTRMDREAVAHVLDPPRVRRGGAAEMEPASSPRVEAGDPVPVKQILRWQDDGGATIPSASLT